MKYLYIVIINIVFTDILISGSKNINYINWSDYSTTSHIIFESNKSFICSQSSGCYGEDSFIETDFIKPLTVKHGNRCNLKNIDSLTLECIVSNLDKIYTLNPNLATEGNDYAFDNPDKSIKLDDIILSELTIYKNKINYSIIVSISFYGYQGSPYINVILKPNNFLLSNSYSILSFNRHELSSIEELP